MSSAWSSDVTAADKNGGRVKEMERGATRTGVEFGLGSRKTTLYLSRTASMMRVPDNQRAMLGSGLSEESDPKSPELDNTVKQENTLDQKCNESSTLTLRELSSHTLRKFLTMPRYSELPTEEMSREFTFTGYDIMTDGLPIPEPRTKSEIKLERAAGLYLATCQRLGITPASYFTQRLLQPEIKMQSHGLGPSGAKAIAVALVDNTTVRELDLADNGIGTDGVRALAEMLSNNSTITDFGVASNRIDAEGTRALAEVLCNHQFITRLDISDNELDDEDARLIQAILEKNVYLTELKASHNKFAEDGGLCFGRALAKNNSLTTLDLSWNHLRGKGAVAIVNGLQKNNGLRTLNVAWNGFGTDGCAALRKSLRVNKTLTELDLTSNRIDVNGVGHLMLALQANSAIKVLRLGQNPMTSDVCLSLLKSLKTSKKTIIETLDLRGLVVDKEFEDVLRTVQDKLPLKVVSGATFRTADILSQEEKHVSSKSQDQRERSIENLEKEQKAEKRISQLTN